MKLIRKLLDEYPEYANLYNQVFADGEPNLPRDIYLVHEDDDKLIGFLSGFPLDQETWYLQVVGFLPSEKKHRTNIYRSWLAMTLLNREWGGILTMIENKNVEALRVALSVGFIVIGTRMDTAGTLWVELLRVRNEKNG